MSTHDYHEDSEILEKSIQARYELRDGNFWSVGKWITGFFVFAAIAFALAYGLMLGIGGVLVRSSHPINLTVPNPPGFIPEKAPLQNSMTTKSDMKELRAKERAETQEYSTTDQAKGTMRIPVDAAIEKLGKQGAKGVMGGSKP